MVIDKAIEREIESSLRNCRKENKTLYQQKASQATDFFSHRIFILPYLNPYNQPLVFKFLGINHL